VINKIDITIEEQLSLLWNATKGVKKFDF